jgi:hypothetical protein
MNAPAAGLNVAAEIVGPAAAAVNMPQPKKPANAGVGVEMQPLNLKNSIDPEKAANAGSEFIERIPELTIGGRKRKNRSRKNRRNMKSRKNRSRKNRSRKNRSRKNRSRKN